MKKKVQKIHGKDGSGQLDIDMGVNVACFHIISKILFQVKDTKCENQNNNISRK